MAKSIKKGKAEKASKVVSKSKPKSKPKTVAKPKPATKATAKKATVKKVATPKAAPAKASKTAVKPKTKAATTSKSAAKKPVAAPKKKLTAKASSTATKTQNKATTVKKTVAKTTSRAPVKKPVAKPAKTKESGTKVLPKKTVNLKPKKNVLPKTTEKAPVSFASGRAFRNGLRPEAIINTKTTETDDMGEEKLRYSEEELKEFEDLILEKLDKARKELNYMKEMLSKKNDEGTDNTAGTMKLLEDGADTLEKENFSQLAVRQQKFVTQLENAMARIKNGTYGVCIDTGKLIPKERLRAVPHTQHSIEAKLNRRD
jgi:DnaK suppressor protein